jgi:hypothetical protein
MSCSLNTKVLTARQWHELHDPHGEATKSYLERQPPSGYKLYALTCPCGAKMIDKEDITDMR